jgi:hypothetical protein
MSALPEVQIVDYRGHINKRIKNAKKGCKCKCFDYMPMGKGFEAYEIKCKMCGCLVKKLCAIPDAEFFDEHSGQRTLIRPVILRELNIYAEITIEFDDGSAHTTMICKGCASKLKDKDLEDLYAADLAQFAKEEDHTRIKVPWRSMAHRKPIGFKRDR